MTKLSIERVEKILREETPKKEDLSTILRGIYTRFLRQYESYFEDINALNDKKIAELREYNNETRSLVRYYYLDIPQNICNALEEFENEVNEKLFGPDWHKYLFDSYNNFRDKNKSRNKSEKSLKAEFREESMNTFYEAMDYIFREGFGTADKATENTLSEIIEKFFKNE